MVLFGRGPQDLRGLRLPAPELNSAGDLSLAHRSQDCNAGHLRIGQSPVRSVPGKSKPGTGCRDPRASPSVGAPARSSEGPLAVGTVVLWRPLPPSMSPQGKVVKRKTPPRPQAWNPQGLGPWRDRHVWSVAQIHGRACFCVHIRGGQADNLGKQGLPAQGPRHSQMPSGMGPLIKSSRLQTFFKL